MINYIKKADQAFSDLTDATGRLQPETLAQFTKTALQSSDVLREIRTVPVPAGVPTYTIPRMDIGTQVLFPEANDGGYPAVGLRSKADLSGVTLTMHSLKGIYRVPYSFIEQNVEGSDFETNIVDMIASKCGDDMANMIFNGDTASGNALLALGNGYVKTITSNIADAGSAAISKEILLEAQRAIPSRFRQDPSKLRFFLNANKVLDWQAAVSARATGLGDSAIVAADTINAYGIRMLRVNQVPTEQGILTDPRNLVLGMAREVDFKMVDKPENSEIIIVFRTRIGFAVENELAASKIIGLTDAA